MRKERDKKTPGDSGVFKEFSNVTKIVKLAKFVHKVQFDDIRILYTINMVNIFLGNVVVIPKT